MADDVDFCAGLVRARDPDRYVATLYAPAAMRPRLFALHALDLELLAVVESTTEPMVGRIRLAWWRERIAALGDQRAPDQPVLRALAAHVVPVMLAPGALVGLDDACEAYLEGEPERWADLRGACLFSAGSKLLGVPDRDVEATGRLWARADAWRRGEEVAVPGDTSPRTPASLRPLLAPAMLALRDVRRGTRRKPGQPDGLALSPGRQLRLLAFMLTGRF